MTIATSQPSALNPTGELEEVIISGTRAGDRQGDLEEVIVGGTRIGGDTFEEVIVTGTSNAPIDGQRLEGVVVTGTSRKKSDPIHLFYPKSLADMTGEFKNAVQFTVYQQKRSQQSEPGDTPARKQLPEQFQNQRAFPFSETAFGLAASARALGTLGFGGVGQTAEDLVGIGAFGIEFFLQGDKPTYGNRTSKIDQTITLYMPDTLVNQDKHDYQPISITQASGRAGLYQQGLNGSPLGKTEVVAELAGKASIFGTRSTEAVLAGLGYALNPMLEMIYGGTQPREFLFQFRFAPRNKEEAEEVLKIIKSFRFHASTEGAGADDITRGSGTRYIIPPNQFEIQFLRKVNGRFQENLALPRIATCTLTGINTNYAAQLDTFTTTTDGIPASISLDLSFVESVIITKADIRNGY